MDLWQGPYTLQGSKHLTLEHPHLPLVSSSQGIIFSYSESCTALLHGLLELVAHGEAAVPPCSKPMVGWSVEGRACSRLREIPGHHYVVIQPPLLITR